MAKGNGGKNTVRTVEQLVRPVVDGMGLRLWDVRFEKEGPDWFLRIFIDRDTPLDTDTCEAVSRAIDPVIDAADPIDQSYCLEVSSPGINRKLTRPEHFEAFLDCFVIAKLIRPLEDGSREVGGILRSREEDGTIVLQTGEEENETTAIAPKDLVSVRVMEEDFLEDE